jgi:hypothetical protein
VYNSEKEKQAIFSWLGKYLHVKFPKKTPFFGNSNEDQYRRFVQRTTLAVAQTTYKIIEEQARSINLYTYELRHGLKAESVFLRKIEISHEDVLWKELLVFFMNTKSISGYLAFLRDIQPLEFDPGLIDDYLQCFQSEGAKAFVMDELEHLYSEMEVNVGERLKLIQAIGSSNICFDYDDEEWEKEND